jgi:hypothetical protein
MKSLVIGSMMLIMAGTSPANGNVSRPKIIASPVPTVTSNAKVLVKLPRVPKPKIFRSNPFRVAYFNSHWEENDDIDIDDDDKITGPRRDQYGRVKVNPTPDDPEGDITPNIEWQLFLIRQAVLLRHRALYS